MQTNPSVALGNNVRAELARRHLNQRHLAEHLGLTPQAVSHKLNGKRPFTTDQIHAVATFLGMRPGDLFDEVPA